MGSRITDAILAKGTAYGFGSAALNLEHGGQNGYMARIGMIDTDGKNYAEWISNAAYVRQNVIPVVLSYPKFLDFMPNSDKLIAAYKALIELHPLTIEGFTSGLTVETDSHPIGGAGEEQEEITDVKRAKTSLTITVKEKRGKAVQKFLDILIRYGYKDPDVKKPLVVKYFNGSALDAVGGMYTPDYYTGTALFIEPDITQRVVVDAWLCTNMFFKNNGDRTGKRDIHSANEVPEYSIESSCITMNNESVFTLADSILATLTVLNKIPDTGIVVPSATIDSSLPAANVGFNH
ncbi:MAG: hypothetical protein JHC33_02825 [Ignisphaera sp.]|nr:hypothetical protein [Ignisphaera sp.]